MKEKTHNIARHFAPHLSYLASKLKAKESEGKIHKIQTQEDRLTEREVDIETEGHAKERSKRKDNKRER